MFTLNTRSAVIYSLALVLFLFHAFADAKLIRGRGRGGVTVSFGSLDLLVPESEINSFDYLNYSYFESMPEVDVVGVIPPGYPMVQGVPDDCFVPLDGTTPFEDDPCYWQFGVNEADLSITGSTVSHFASAMQNITWQIFEADAIPSIDAPLYEFDNSHTVVGPKPTSGTPPFASEVSFNAPMPISLAPGEYQIMVTMEQLAPSGYVFYSADTINSAEACIGPVNNIQCVRFGEVSGTTFTQVAIERLVIVNEPGILLVLFSGLVFVFIRRRRLESRF